MIKVGSPHARNVLVLEPGTSAGAAYFVPLAQWIVAGAPEWQVWSVERRENLLEDQSVLQPRQAGARHLHPAVRLLPRLARSRRLIRAAHPADPELPAWFAKRWGMQVAVGDLHRVIAAARRLGGKVVLGGHSLGGAVVTAYATWDFDGHAGAATSPALVYIDGGSLPAVSAAHCPVRATGARLIRDARRGSRSAASRPRSPDCSA